jgi:uncharacterized protein YndB with AHSA1/START domain
VRFERRTYIDVPPDVVFAYLADFPRHSEWAGDPLRIEQTSPGPVGVGSTFRSVGHEGGREHDQPFTVTGFTPNEYLAFEVDAGFGTVRHWFRIQPDGAGARLAKGTEELLRARFPLNLVTVIWNWFSLPRGLEGNLQRIKARLEGQVQRSP